jgi:DnaK suppressor protein
MQQRKKLLRTRASLLQQIKRLTAEAREDVPAYSLHMGDAATDSFDRDLTLGLASFEQEALYEVDTALRRIDDGTYGVCELTGRPISWARLRAIPWARFSVDAEKMLETPGFSHPHLGELRSTRLSGEQASQPAVDEEAENSMD